VQDRAKTLAAAQRAGLSPYLAQIKPDVDGNSYYGLRRQQSVRFLKQLEDYG